MDREKSRNDFLRSISKMQTKRPQQPLLVLQTTKHRAIANARERDRTESVNNAFTLLRRLLPTNPKDRKLSKIEILRLATSYIHHLDNVCWAITNGEPSENVCCRMRSSTIRQSNVCTFCITSPLQSLNLFPQTNNQSEQFKNDNTTMVMYNENLNQTETSDGDQQPPYRGSEFEFPAIPHIDIDDSGNNFLIMPPINYINNYGDNNGVVYVDHDEQAYEEFWPLNFSWPNDGDT